MSQNLIENISYACTKAIFKTRLDDLTEAALSEGVSQGVLLLEEFDNEDANQLQQAAKEMSQVISDFEGKVSDLGGGWKPVVDALKSAVETLDTKQIATLAISGDKKKLAKAAADYTKKLQSAASETAAILNATSQMKRNLANFKDDVGDKGDESIAALASSIEKFPDVSKLDKGIDSIYEVPKWFNAAWKEGSEAASKETEGGFFKKAMNFIGGLFKGAKSGRLVDVKVLADAIKMTPFNKLMDLDLQAETQKLTASSEEAATETAELSSAAAAAQAETKGESPTKSDESSEEGVVVATDEEADAEVADAQKELEAAAQEVVEEPLAPAAAVAKALDDWASGLSASSQKTLASAGRLESLKSGVAGSLEKAADTVASEVAAAVQAWRSENEETLIKSKRFAKSNFDSLESLIPQIAAQMLKKTSESRFRLTKGMVKNSVYRFLDKKFKSDGVLFESKRWGVLAGVKEK